MKVRTLFVFTAFFMSAAAAEDAFAAVGYGDPLTVTTGRIIYVSTAAELKNVIHNDLNISGGPATVLLSNGVYNLSGGDNYIYIQPVARDIIIRSVSGNRDEVFVRGSSGGYGSDVESCFSVAASNVTIADITIGYCMYHGIQAWGHEPYNAAGLYVHNCHFINCNEQHIKGTSSTNDPIGITDGIIENCTFEFTNNFAYQSYTGGLDIHKGINWIVRDNLFKNIRSPSGDAAEHAIHFWKAAPVAQNVVCERNIIINCDRGIGFGLGGAADGFTGPGTIKNNFVYNDGNGNFDDVGVGLESATNVNVYNNTVFLESYWAAIEYRFSGTSGGNIMNNLVNKQIAARNGGSATVSNNFTSAQSTFFVDCPAGDLHLVDTAAQAVDTGLEITEVKFDIDGDPRPYNVVTDIGADEYIPEPFLFIIYYLSFIIYCWKMKFIRVSAGQT